MNLNEMEIQELKDHLILEICEQESIQAVKNILRNSYDLLDIKMILKFEVPGKPSPNHRARIRTRDRNGNLLKKVRSHKDPKYDAWFNLVNATAKSKAFYSNYQIPDKDQKLRMFLHFWWSTRRRTLFKKGKRKNTWGWTGVAKPDSGNLIKGIEDACQDVLYHNDQRVETERWPGCNDFITYVKMPDEQKVLVGIAFKNGQGNN